jgi:hypothetical protein
MSDAVESNSKRKVAYAFRRPRFLVLYAVGDELHAAGSWPAPRRQLEQLELQEAAVLDLVDATARAGPSIPI